MPYGFRASGLPHKGSLSLSLSLCKARAHTSGKEAARAETLEEQAFSAATAKSFGLRVHVMADFSPMMPASVALSQK